MSESWSVSYTCTNLFINWVIVQAGVPDGTPEVEVQVRHLQHVVAPGSFGWVLLEP